MSLMKQNFDANYDADIKIPLNNLESVEQAYKIEKEISNKTIHRSITVKILLGSILITAVISTGMAIGYSAVLLPQLKSINGSLHVDEEMGSWIVASVVLFPASLPAIATPVGAIVSGILMDYLGRKLTLQIQTAVAIAGWIFIVVCKNHGMILAGRFILGVGNGIVMAASQIYIAEVSDPNMRGIFSNFPLASYSLGIFLVYLLGSVFHWRLVAGLAIIPSFASALMYFILPESPVWLVRHGHIKKAKNACLWLQGNNAIQAQKEVQGLIDRAQLEQPQHLQPTWKLLCTPPILKPLLIVNVYNVFQVISGWFLLILYAMEIISYVDKDINQFVAVILTASVRFIFAIAACFVLAFIGRRAIGVYTALFAAISIFSLGASIYFDYGTNKYFISACLLLYVAATTLGFMALPAVMSGELFPARARASAGSVTLIFSCSLVFGYAKLFPWLKDLLQMHGLFLLFSIASLLASVWVYFLLPETKGKTLNEIEDYFSQDNVLWIGRNKKADKIRKTEIIKL